MDLTIILQQVDELKVAIDALRPINWEQEQRIMQKFRLDWNYHSNAIEGNTLTLVVVSNILMKELDLWLQLLFFTAPT